MKAHEACGPLEIDSALKTVQTLKSELQDAKMSVIDGQLKPLPGETVSTFHVQRQNMMSRSAKPVVHLCVFCCSHSWRSALRI